MIAPDSSVVVAALAPWHVSHAVAGQALADAPNVRLVAHVAFETTSALSRMPEGRRIAAGVVVEALARRFPGDWLALDGTHLRSALQAATAAGIGGGGLYDALIVATAEHHGARLLTADRRARRVYEVLDAQPLYLSA